MNQIYVTKEVKQKPYVSSFGTLNRDQLLGDHGKHLGTAQTNTKLRHITRMTGKYLLQLGITNGQQLLGNDGENLDVDAIEFVEA